MLGIDYCEHRACEYTLCYTGICNLHRLLRVCTRIYAIKRAQANARTKAAANLSFSPPSPSPCVRRYVNAFFMQLP